MRSFGFTLILALTAVLVCGLAAWQWAGGNLNSVLGMPPTPVGQHLYSSFKPADVKHIRVNQNGITATFTLGEKGWMAEAPWQDRMDPRSAVGIINFTLGLKVQDYTPLEKIDPQKAGIKESGIDIRLEDGNHQHLARYKMGRRTPWLSEREGADKPDPTVFIQPRDPDRKGHVYACTGDIASLFNDGLKFLRDHHPFYFNPITLQKIRIRSAAGELTLGRANEKSPWRVVKPLDLHTDPVAIKTLIEGLYELHAGKVSDRASVTLPTKSATESTQIALTSFGSDTETLLEIFPPDPADASDAKATVSDRPGTVFDLPLKPEPGLISLADLPLSVDDLRDPTLTNLNIQSLRAVSISPTTGKEILIARTPPQRWMVTIDDQAQEANEERLFTLLKAVTEGRAIGFESDAATDFTPWGLDKPFLKLRFLGQDNQTLELVFGMDGKGGYFVNRTGTPTVMRVDESLMASIASRSFEWRHARLWSVNRVNLLTLGRKMGNEAPLLLGYRFQDESWVAKQDERDLTPQLNPAHANYLLGVLEGLKVSRWLAPTDEAAMAAMERPSLTLTVVEKATDDEGEDAGFIKRTVRFAPNTLGPNPSFYYGRLDSDMQPFLLDRDTYNKIATDVFDEK